MVTHISQSAAAKSTYHTGDCSCQQKKLQVKKKIERKKEGLGPKKKGVGYLLLLRSFPRHSRFRVDPTRAKQQRQRH